MKIIFSKSVSNKMILKLATELLKLAADHYGIVCGGVGGCAAECGASNA